MKLVQAERFAKAVIAAQLPRGWSFRWNRSKVCYGMCGFVTRTIELSRFWTAHHAAWQVADTIAHEVAHALAGPRVKPHGPKWQQIAARLGAVPRASA